MPKTGASSGPIIFLRVEAAVLHTNKTSQI